MEIAPASKTLLPGQSRRKRQPITSLARLDAAARAENGEPPRSLPTASELHRLALTTLDEKDQASFTAATRLTEALYDKAIQRYEYLKKAAADQAAKDANQALLDEAAEKATAVAAVDDSIEAELNDPDAHPGGANQGTDEERAALAATNAEAPADPLAYQGEKAEGDSEPSKPEPEDSTETGTDDEPIDPQPGKAEPDEDATPPAEDEPDETTTDEPEPAESDPEPENDTEVPEHDPEDEARMDAAFAAAMESADDDTIDPATD
mgnify:CR=1 FL=1|tara:strand:- start:5707 stop:6501 length:795 start_codon:yes stop_codon:yes gene_type:complete